MLNIFLTSTPGPSAGSGGATTIPTEFGSVPAGSGALASYLEKVYDWALPIGSALAILMLIYAGYVFITSAGNPERVSEAKTITAYALSGLVLLILAGVIYKMLMSGSL